MSEEGVRREMRERERNRLNTLKSRSSNPGLSKVEANPLGGLSGINTVSLATATLLLISDGSVLRILTVTIIVLLYMYCVYIYQHTVKPVIQTDRNKTVCPYFLNVSVHFKLHPQLHCI